MHKWERTMLLLASDGHRGKEMWIMMTRVYMREDTFNVHPAFGPPAEEQSQF